MFLSIGNTPLLPTIMQGNSFFFFLGVLCEILNLSSEEEAKISFARQPSVECPLVAAGEVLTDRKSATAALSISKLLPALDMCSLCGSIDFQMRVFACFWACVFVSVLVLL